MEENKIRLEHALESLANDIDKLRMRKMQASMHRCAAHCYENKTNSMEQVHQCVEDCSGQVKLAQEFLQNEMQNFQNRLQRCYLQCKDDIQDKMVTNPTEAEVRNYNHQFEQCASSCVDKHIILLPRLLKKMDDELGKGAYEPLPHYV